LHEVLDSHVEELVVARGHGLVVVDVVRVKTRRVAAGDGDSEAPLVVCGIPNDRCFDLFTVGPNPVRSPARRRRNGRCGDAWIARLVAHTLPIPPV